MKIRNWTWRIFIILIAAVVLIGSMPTVAFAAATSSVYNDVMGLSVSSTTGMPGETVQVTVNISNNPGLASLKFDVQYDSVLTLTAIEFNSAFGNMVTAPEPYQSPQPITMISPLSDISENGVFATLSFEIADSALDGYSAGINIVFDPADVFDGDENRIDLNITNGKIQVFHGIPGDIDGDKKVNTKDAIDLFRYVSGWNIAVDNDALDVNGDGSVNTKDAIALFRYVAGWSVEIVRPVKHIHSLAIFAATESTCTERGNIAYYFCDGCGKYYSDSAGDSEISWSDTRLDLIDHSMSKIDFAPSSCTEEGNYEYWTCDVCSGYFSDMAGAIKIELTNTIIPALGHDMIMITKSDATCTSNGNITHWHCNACGKNYIEEEGITEINIEDTVVSADGHTLYLIDAKDVTCTEDGNSEYWYCSACECYFADSETETEINRSDTIIPATGHGDNLRYHEKADATVDEIGMEEYWECTVCGKCYLDANAKIEIYSLDSLIIPVVPSYAITFVDNKNWPNGNTVKFAQDENLLLTTYLPPEVLGYNFGGWYTTSTFSDGTKKDYILKGNTQDYILYAKWTPISYNITYKNAAEHSNALTYTVDDEIVFSNPEWSGLVFTHWTDSEGNTITGIPRGTVGDIIIEANWKYKRNLAVSNPDKYTYIGGTTDSQSRYYFIYEIGTIENIVLDTQYVHKYDNLTNINRVQSITYRVQVEEAQSASRAIANSVIKSAEWTDLSNWISYSSTSETNGFTLCPEIEVAGVAAKVWEFSSEETEVEEDTYSETFSEVNSGTNGTEISYTTASSISYLMEEETTSTVDVQFTKNVSPTGVYSYVRAADAKVYAIVTYDPNEEEYYLDLYSMVIRVFDTVLFELAGDEQYSVNIVSSNLLDFEIPYESIPNMFYTVEYNANGGSGEMLKSVHESGVYSSLLPNDGYLPVEGSIDYGFSRTGYTFGGWKTTKDGSSAIYADASSVCDIAGPGETVTLYAHWIPNTYSISYNSNSGNCTMQTSYHVYDVAYSLSENNFTRTGYTFLGWSQDSNATSAEYSDQAEIENLSSTNGDDITLYAIWEANSYYVTYDLNSSSIKTIPSVGTPGKSITYDSSDELAVPAAEYYTFEGWYTAAEGGTQLTDDAGKPTDTWSVSENITIYAHWVQTESEYIYIKTVEDLRDIALAPDAKYMLIDDIRNVGAWTPIANFSGELHGNGKTISGMTYSFYDGADVDWGMFITVNSGAKIHKVTFNDCSATYAPSSEGYATYEVRFGFVAAFNYGKIEDCIFTDNKININGNTKEADQFNYAGVIVSANFGTIDQCRVAECKINLDSDAVTSETTTTMNAKAIAGGVCAENLSGATVSNCTSEGNTIETRVCYFSGDEGRDVVAAAGGIMGFNYGTQTGNTYENNTLTATKRYDWKNWLGIRKITTESADTGEIYARS